MVGDRVGGGCGTADYGGADVGVYFVGCGLGSGEGGGEEGAEDGVVDEEVVAGAGGVCGCYIPDGDAGS